MQAHNNEKENLVLTQLPTIQRAYIQSTSDFHQNFYISPPPKQISLLGTSSNYIVKVIKLLHDVPKASINRFIVYHLHYKEKPGMIESTYDLFLFRPPPKLLSLFDASSDYIIKFATYHPHYKEKIISNPTRTFVCAANCLYFSYGWSNFFKCGWNNLSMAFFLAQNNGLYTAKLGLVTKKGELPITFIYFSNHLQPPSLLLSLMLSKMRLAMFK